MHINDSFYAEYSTILEREEAVPGYPVTKIQNCYEHLRKHSDCLCKFSEGSQTFSNASDAIP